MRVRAESSSSTRTEPAPTATRSTSSSVSSPRTRIVSFMGRQDRGRPRERQAVSVLLETADLLLRIVQLHVRIRPQVDAEHEAEIPVRALPEVEVRVPVV